MKKLIIPILFLLTISTVSAAEILTDCEGITEPGDYIIRGEILHDRHIGSCFKVYTNNVNIRCENENIIGDMKTAFEILNVENVTIEDCHVYEFSYGVRLYFSENIVIKNSNFIGNTVGIIIVKSEGNTIENNLIAYNDADGIQLKYSDKNTIFNNTIHHSSNSVNLIKSDENLFLNNVIIRNDFYGISLYLSNQNEVNENFICENPTDFKESSYLQNTFISNTCCDSERCEFDCSLDCIDNDHDGYYSTEGCGFVLDCDDSSRTTYPTASEICWNEIDDNCNGLIDENCFEVPVTTTSSTTTTVPPSGAMTICNLESTSCYHSCDKKCPSEFDYCNFRFVGSKKTVIGTIGGGESLPWVVSTSRMNCFVEGVHL